MIFNAGCTCLRFQVDVSDVASVTCRSRDTAELREPTKISDGWQICLVLFE